MFSQTHRAAPEARRWTFGIGDLAGWCGHGRGVGGYTAEPDSGGGRFGAEAERKFFVCAGVGRGGTADQRGVNNHAARVLVAVRY